MKAQFLPHIHLRFLSFILVLAVFLSACGQEKTKKLEGGEGREATSAQSNTNSNDTANQNDSAAGVFANAPAITPNDFTFPAIEGLEGTLILVRGNQRNVGSQDGEGGQIYLVSASGGVPEKLATHVYTPTLALSPNHEYLVFMGLEGRHWGAYALNTQSRELTKIVDLGNQNYFVSDWSPDGQWVVLASPPVIGGGSTLAKLDGTTSLELDQFGTFWTEDNRLLLSTNVNLFFPYNDNNGAYIEVPPTLEILDPTTQSRTALDLGAGVDMSDPTWLSQALDEFATQEIEIVSMLPASGMFGTGIHYNGGDDFYHVWQDTPTISFGSSPKICDTWHIDHVGQGSYTVADTAVISDFQVGADGNIYFMRWWLPECKLNLTALQADVMQIDSNGEMKTVVSNIYTGYNTAIALVRGFNAIKFALSPDGNYTAWVGGKFENLSTTLNITHMPSGESIPVMQIDSTEPNAFLSVEAFTSVFWIE